MKTQPLGQTGMDVSVLGLGTVKWGRNQNVKYADFELPEDATLHRLLDIAEAAGINFIDTAPAYGIAEIRVGQILKERAGAKFIVATKTGEEFAEGQSTYNFSAKHTESTVYRSLGRLGTQFLDMVMVHCSPSDLLNLEDSAVIETLTRFKDQGLIRSIGVSTMTVAGGLRAAELADAVMVPYSIGYREHLPVIEKAHSLGKAVLIKRALYSGPSLEQNLPLSDHLKAVYQVPGVTSLIAGTINPKHLQENIDATNAALRELAETAAA